jgi:hypothetical protein
VLQYSPALAAGVAIMPNTRVDNTTADAVSVFDVGFISCPLGKFEVLLLAARLLNREFSKSKPAFTIQKMHSLHRDMRDLNYAGEPVPAMCGTATALKRLVRINCQASAKGFWWTASVQPD